MIENLYKKKKCIISTHFCYVLDWKIKSIIDFKRAIWWILIGISVALIRLQKLICSENRQSGLSILKKRKCKVHDKIESYIKKKEGNKEMKKRLM